MKRKLRCGIALALLFAPSLLFAQAQTAPEELNLFYYKEGVHMEFNEGRSTMHLQGRLQVRLTYLNQEAASDSDTFAVARGKLKMEGNVYSKAIRYGLQLNFATRNRESTTAVCTNAGCTTTANAITGESTTGFGILEDYFVDWVPFYAVGIKVGQYKVPFLMQELTSSGKQQFVDRALSSSFFNLSRDIGATLHGDLFDAYLNYALFVMNGDGINTLNRNKDIMVGARFEFPLLGEYKPTEADVDWSEEPNIGVGIAYAYNKAVAALQSGMIPAATKASHGTIDAGFKYHGWSLQTAGMMTRSHADAATTNWGTNGQIGYFAIPRKLEFALREAAIFVDGGAPRQYEHAAAVNYYIFKHALKIQADYAWLKSVRAAELIDHRVRTQVQVVF